MEKTGTDPRTRKNEFKNKEEGKNTMRSLQTAIIFLLMSLLVSCGQVVGWPEADHTAPIVSSISPVHGATDVALAAIITATFSEAMDPATITATTFTIKDGAPAIAGTVTYANSTATFTPTSALTSGTVYTATITTGVEDLEGNAMANTYVWSFATGPIIDIAAPTVSSTTPLNNATAVAFNAAISATFSEAMDPATITDATFTLLDGTTPVAGTVLYAGVTAIFTPTVILKSDTEYTATIKTGATDLAGNPLAANYVWKFTTGTSADTTAPTVILTSPVDDAAGMAFNAAISATFSEPMSPLTVTGVSFTLFNGLTQVNGTVMFVGVTAIFTPTVNLDPATEYTATITTGVTDLAGNAMAAEYEWTFTTGTDADIIAPTVTLTTPADDATAVAQNAAITATFSEAMNPLTITGVSFTLFNGLTQINGSVLYVGTTAIFTPTTILDPAIEYTVTITTGVTDLAGNAMAADYVWTFTTATGLDTIAPTVLSTDPADLATNVLLDATVSATFSEAMAPLTVTNVSFTLFNGLVQVDGTVLYAGTTATFTPDVDLDPDTEYTATITTTATDLVGNPLAADYVWTFTTAGILDTIAPTVLSTDPADLDINVPLDATVSATFSEAMDPLTVTDVSFTLFDGLVQVDGTVLYAGTTATFTPDVDLDPATLYTATITTTATDLAGNPLAADYEWTFTTAGILDTTAPTVISTLPDDLDTFVLLDATVSATFSEAMDPLTVTDVSFTLFDGLVQVDGTVLYAGTTATFTPDVDLDPATLYTATITTTATDLAGNPLAADYVWTFTTIETTPPTVLSTNPDDLDTNVLLDATVSATFSETMALATVTDLSFTLFDGLVQVDGTVLYVGTTATFTPDVDLDPETLYTATITTGVTDLAGNALAADYVWTFTTIENTPPTVLSTSPDNLDPEVLLDATVSAIFSEAMDSLTITDLSFTLFEGITQVDGTVLYVGTTATFTPDEELDPDTEYTATITTGATDVAGNALAANYVWKFTTAGPVILVDLGLAAPFAIASTKGVTNTITTPLTHINGDVVLDPLAECNGIPIDAAGGFGACGGMAPTINGTVYSDLYPDAGATSAAVIADLRQTFIDLSPANLVGTPATINLPAGTTLGAVTGSALVQGDNYFTPGVYQSLTSIMITGDLTLDGLGDPNAIFVFQSSSSIGTAAQAAGVDTHIILIGKAKAANVWWWAGSAATLGTYSQFQGNILAYDDITMETGANSCGRLFAGASTDGAFVFDTNVVSVPSKTGCP